AGVFFLAYFLFEVPSNIILDRVGARRWIARIMLSWGVVSGAMAFTPNVAAATGLSAEHTFYLLRVLLGFAEAGFFPGIIFFLTLWFPASHRARIVSYFMAAIPLSSALGSPVSAALLGLDGAWGLRGWQWLFIVEALPSIILAFVTFFYLTDRPVDAKWLNPEARAWLARRLALEDRRREHVSPASALASLADGRVLALSLVYFGAVACLYGVGFWLPTIVKGFGISIAMTGWVNAIPYVVGFVGMVWWGLSSDRMGERTLHLAIALALAAIGIGGSAFLTDATLKMIALTIGAIGVFASLSTFWTLPTAFLAGAAVAPGIAAINSIGNLAGYFGPFAMGWIKDATGNFVWGLVTIAACAVVALAITLALGHDPHLERAPEAAG
ncbi:MAG TPA: MFS transporter, partial [Roseiarcus sp.]|nr:MFS transporter [Roseiarcus sp.]